MITEFIPDTYLSLGGHPKNCSTDSDLLFIEPVQEDREILSANLHRQASRLGAKGSRPGCAGVTGFQIEK